MPIREFRCKQCHSEFEELVFGDALPPCTECGASRVEPLMSACCIQGVGHGADSGMSAPASSGGCSGCSGGSCASCH